MRRNILLMFVLFFNVIAYSQEEVMKVIAKETCECLEAKKKTSDNFTGEELKGAVGICMLKSYTDHLPEVTNKVEFSDTVGMTNLGKDVAVKMLEFCPNMILELGKLKESNTQTEEVDPIVSGEVTEVKIEQFITLQIKDQNGRSYSFILLDYFDTASLLTNNEIKKKDKLNVSYTEIELFDAKSKEFRYYKILTKLEKI